MVVNLHLISNLINAKTTSSILMRRGLRGSNLDLIGAQRIVRHISGNHRHFQYCCIFSGLNCCCGKGTKWERMWGRLTEKQVEKEYGVKYS